jgi:hypothetical protein
MANSYDRIFKENIEPLQLPLLAKLLGLVPPKLAAIEAKMQVTQEAEMDSIRRVVHPDSALDYGLQIEFHLSDEDLRWRNLLHYGLFYQITKLPLRQIVIYGGTVSPKKITENILELSGLRLAYEVIVLKDIPKETFIHSDIPEEVILAILCDYGTDKPESVVRIILQNLKKILRNSEKIRKYHKQLLVLSRLRKVELIALKEIEAMNIHYDIETDGLYLQGVEKGIELERKEKEREFTLNLWKLQAFPVRQIASLSGTSEQRVVKIITAYLQKQEGRTQEEIDHLLKPFMS